MSSAVATRCSSMRKASLPIIALIREVTNPGDSLTTTHSLPIRSPTARSVAMVSSEVSRPRTSSISRIRCTGLKKCMPAKRCGRPLTAAISVIDSPEVLLASSASAGAAATTWRKVSILISIDSGTASITRSASPTAAARSPPVVSSRSAWSASRARTLPSSTPLSRLRAMTSRARSRAVASTS